MESEKVKDIKKIAMSCVEKNKPHCEDCTKKDEDDVVLTCRSLLKDCLTLINELESENESCHEVLADLKTIIKQQNDRIAELENIGLNENITVGEYLSELQRLKDKVAELENEIRENAFYSKGYADGIKNTYEVVMPDKLKQFAKMLKEKLKEKVNADNVDVFVECAKLSDETLKEFIGE